MVIISMNINAQTLYKHFVSLHNKSVRQKKKSDLPRCNQNKFNQATDIGLYLLTHNSPTKGKI